MKVLFDFSAGQIGIEGDGPELVQLLQLVHEIAPKLPAINILTTPPKAGNGQTNGAGKHSLIADHPAPANGTTMRQFVRSLSLGSVAERITAIAYYQKHHGQRDSVSPKEMADWFTHCGLQKPSQMPVAMFEAKKRCGYMENASHGLWKISTQGENFVTGKLEEAKSRVGQEE
jgi:hypothetical protein